MSISTDQQRTRRAAARIGFWVAGASAIVIATGVGILVAIILATSRFERDGRGPDHNRANPDHVVVDVDRVLPWVVVLGIAGVCVLAIVAWIAARRAVQPLTEALRLQRQFVSDASHELRTPLTALDSRIQILNRRHERQEPIEPVLAELQRDAATMNDVLIDLLLAAESAAAADAVADVSAAARDARRLLEPLAAETNVTIDVDIADQLRVGVPPVTLTRLLVALSDNAIQHSPPQGTVTLNGALEGDRAVMRVSDEGSGIAPQHRERVFDRFSRGADASRRRGFGLGLSLVRDVVQRHGGSVTIESTSTTGTVFVLTLPAVWSRTGHA